ncbi:MAG: NAD-dependent epimerase/dehydratase family protein [Rhodothermales bacterium]|nr:NAD-dependent epimerase/dehydratase family protein [Rhodothermales bacterium]
MRVLVIGGTGFVGAAAVRRLAAAGHAVAVYHRGRTAAALPPAVQTLHGDRLDLPQRRSELERFQPDAVLDTCAYTEHEAAPAIEALRGIAARAVVLSSGDVYRAYDRLRSGAGPVEPVPLSESAPLRTSRYPYRAHAEPGTRLHEYDKVLVEAAYRAAPPLTLTVLRLPAVYGPGDPQHRLYPLLRRMDDGRPAILLEEGQDVWRWTRGYVENVAAAIALAVADERAAGRTYNLGEAEARTERAWVEAVGEAAGWSGAVVAVPGDGLPAPLRQPLDWRQDLVLDTGRIRAELGYAEPVGRAEALRRTVAWARAHPPPDRAAFDYAAEDAALRAAPRRPRQSES